MERRKIRGNRSMFPQWHQSQSVKVAERLYCLCGALMYEGPKPNFTRISCPKCKKITELERPKK